MLNKLQELEAGLRGFPSRHVNTVTIFFLQLSLDSFLVVENGVISLQLLLLTSSWGLEGECC